MQEFKHIGQKVKVLRICTTLSKETIVFTGYRFVFIEIQKGEDGQFIKNLLSENGVDVSELKETE